MRDFNEFMFSKSSTLRYKQCGLSFYFQYATEFGKLFRQGETPDFLTRGNILHEFYEEYNKGSDVNYIEKMLCKDDLYADNIFGFYKILEHYQMTTAIESESRYDNKELHFTGFIDAVYNLSPETRSIILSELENPPKSKIKGSLAIIDYKTGKYHSYLQRKYEYELNLYVILYESMTGKKIDWIGMFYTNEPYNSFIIPVNRRKVANDLKDFNHQKENIINGIFARSQSPLCNYCDFKNICEDYSDDCIEPATNFEKFY